MKVGIELRAACNREVTPEERESLQTAVNNGTVEDAKRVFAEFLNLPNVQISLRITNLGE